MLGSCAAGFLPKNIAGAAEDDAALHDVVDYESVQRSGGERANNRGAVIG